MRVSTITTARLNMRAFTDEDVDPLHRILGEKDMLRYFPNPNPPSRDQVHNMVSRIRKHWEERGYGLWAVESRLTGELMGRSGLQYLPETDEVEVDFLLGRDYWGQGFATEAGLASLRYGFEALGAESIVGIVHPDNKASQRVLKKLGMKFTRKANYFGMNCYRFAIKQTQWATKSLH